MSAVFLEVLDRFLADYDIVHFAAKEVAPIGKAAGTSEDAPRLMPPPAELWGFMVPTLHVAEWLRKQVAKPVIVTSGWRDARYNRAVGGAKDSMHVQFCALDVRVAGFTGNALAKVLEMHPLSQYMGIGTYPNSPAIVHMDVRGLLGRTAPARWTG